MATRKTARFAAKEVMQRLAYDPLEVLIQCASEPSAPAEVKREVAEYLMPFMYPRLSNMEVQAEVETSEVNRPNEQDLMRRILSNPELADAAQKLSLEAAGVLLADGAEGTIQ